MWLESHLKKDVEQNKAVTGAERVAHRSKQSS